jgi:hypothetical protein
MLEKYKVLRRTQSNKPLMQERRYTIMPYPTDIAMDLANFEYDKEFIKSDMADNEVNDLVINNDAREQGTTVDALDDMGSDEDKKELDETIEMIDGYDTSDDILKIVNSNKDKMSLDEVMGIEPDEDDDSIVAELSKVMDSDDEIEDAIAYTN